MDFFENAKRQPSFNQWLSTMPEEDLQYLSTIGDEVGNGTLKDQDTFEQMVALILHFTGKGEMSEQEIEDAFYILIIDLALELNVREGNMTKTGIYSLLKNEETVRLSMTDRGNEFVKNLMPPKEQP